MQLLGWYLVWIGVLTVITFVAYGWDKMKAVKGGWRVPERTLHVLALLGGFLGGWLGRAVFHHKTLHRSFTTVLALATVLHAALIAWLTTRG